MFPSTISRIVGDFPSGPENSQAFLTLRVLWVIKSTVRSGAAASYPIPATNHSRNLTRDSPGDAPAPGPSLKRAFETLLRRVWHRGGGRGKQASKKERDGERERSAPSTSASSSPIKKGSHRLMMKTGIVGPATASRSLRRPYYLDAFLLSLLYQMRRRRTRSAGRSVRRHPKSARDEFPINLGFLRSPKEFLPLAPRSVSLSKPCMIRQGGFDIRGGWGGSKLKRVQSSLAASCADSGPMDGHRLEQLYKFLPASPSLPLRSPLARRRVWL